MRRLLTLLLGNFSSYECNDIGNKWDQLTNYDMSVNFCIDTEMMFPWILKDMKNFILWMKT